MKKSLLGVIVIVFSIFASFAVTQTALAYFLGGHIINTVVPEITSWENEYDCNLNGGSTLEISSPTGANTSYYIPGYVTPLTQTTPGMYQGILGMYDGYTAITCTRDEDKDATSQITVYLPTIIYFGTSEV